MSVKLMKDIWGVKRGFFTSTEKFVLIKLADFAQEDGSSIYPSLERVSEETSLSIRTVKRTIEALLGKKVLELVKCFKERKPNIYKINVDILQVINKESENYLDKVSKSDPQQMDKVSKSEIGKNEKLDMVSTYLDKVSSYLDTVALHPLVEPLIEPLTLLSVSSKRPVADAPRNCVLQNSVLEGIQNTPPGGCVEGLSSQDQNPELLKGSSLQGLGIGYSYGVSLGNPSLEGGFSSVLENTSKTGLISGHEGQSLVSIENYQKTSPDAINGPAIDVSSEKRDSESQKASSRKKPKTKASLDEDGFKKWYDLYPRKVSRKKALQAFGKAVKIVDFETLLDLTRSYAQSVEDKDKTFVPHPASWLNGERWEDMRSEGSFQTSSATLSQSPQRPVMHPRLQAFVTAHHQLGSNAFAFQSCEVVEHADKIILQVPSRHCLDKVDLYHRELEDHFGKEVEMVIKAPQPEVLAEKPVVTLSEIDFLEPRLKAFLEKNIQIDAGVHFAFKATTITETADTILLHNDLAYGLSKVDFYARDLEKFFGKRVEVPSKSPPRSHHPQPLQTVELPKAEEDTTRKYSPNNNGQLTPGVVLKEEFKDLRTTPGVNTFPYKSIGVVLQEARQGVGR